MPLLKYYLSIFLNMNKKGLTIEEDIAPKIYIEVKFKN